MASPYLQPESVPMQDAAGLLPLLSAAAHRVRQHSEAQAMYEALVGALHGSDYGVLILRLDQAHQLQLAGSSLDQSQETAMRAQLNVDATTDGAHQMLHLLQDGTTRLASVGELCNELFTPGQTATIGGWLGGAQRRCLLLPLHAHDVPLGMLCLVADTIEPQERVAAQLFAEHLSVALTLASVLSHVQKARSKLAADHLAMFDLSQALCATGQTAPGAPRSLVPRSRSATAVGKSVWPTQAPRAYRLLLVEDDERIRKSTSELLEGLGYTVVGVDSGEQAISAYARGREQDQRFDLVLMDQTLGGRMNGIETLRILRSVDSGVRAILLSGQGGERHGEQARKHGFAAALTKPIPLGDLQTAIVQVLNASYHA